MRVDIGDGVRLFVDVDGFGLVPDEDGMRMRDRPTIIAMHGGPGFDHAGLKLGLTRLRDVAQLIVYDHRGHGRSDGGRRTSGRSTPGPMISCAFAKRSGSTSRSCSATPSVGS